MVGSIGIIRSSMQLGYYDSVLVEGYKLLDVGLVQPNILSELYLLMGKSYLKLNILDSAERYFKLTSDITKSELGAEAKYNIAYINYLKQDYKESERMIFEIINQVPSYDYWIAKSFILLADNYSSNGNVFQAKHTLKSIVDNYEGEDLKEIAKHKLDSLINSEKIIYDSNKNKDRDDVMNEDNNVEDSNAKNNDIIIDENGIINNDTTKVINKVEVPENNKKDEINKEEEDNKKNKNKKDEGKKNKEIDLNDF